MLLSLQVLAALLVLGGLAVSFVGKGRKITRTSNTGYLGRCVNDLLRHRPRNESLQKLRALLASLEFFPALLWPQESLTLKLCFIGILLCIGTERTLNISIPLHLGLTIDKLQDPNLPLPWKEIVSYLLCRVVASKLGISAVQRYLWSRLEIHGVHQLSASAYAHHMSLSKDYHETASSHTIAQSIQGGRSIIALLRIVCFDLLPLTVDIAVGAEYVARVIDKTLAGIAVSTIISLLFLAWNTSDFGSSLQRKYISAMTKESRILAETSSNWASVAYFDQFDTEALRYASAVKLSQSSIEDYLLTNMLIEGVKYLVTMVGLGAACYFTAYRIKAGEAKLGDFAMLITYWGQLVAPLEAVGAAFTQITRSLVNAENLLELFDMKPSVVDRQGASDLHLKDGSVEFTHVHFSHGHDPESTVILEDIDLAIPGGSTVGIVGASGGGKTSILHLLYRFYDPTSGLVKIDDQDISQVTLKSLRASIAIVPQTPVLFNKSILDNLRYARPNASFQECQHACRLAEMHEVILAFPEQYNTVVGERGAKLSGGERQRVAIAQAILKGSKILLLDEASSHLDALTEARIHENLRRQMGRCTVVVVTHRLSTVVAADLLLVVDKGRIVERGTHEKLVARNGRYGRLWERHASGEWERSSS